MGIAHTVRRSRLDSEILLATIRPRLVDRRSMNVNRELIGILVASSLAGVAAAAHGGRYFIIVFATTGLIAFLEARRRIGNE
jgi:hypothetical protein